MRVLVISESIDVEDSSASKVNVAMIKNLMTEGYQVKVLHYTRKTINIDGIDCIAIKERKFNLNYVLSRSQRLFQRYFKVNLSEFLEHIFGHSFTFFNDSNSIASAVKANYNGEDLIITLSKGASFRAHHAMLKLTQLHKKWLAYIHDPYPFHFYPRPYNWVEKGYKYKESFFRAVTEKAGMSGFPSKLLQEWMGSYFPNCLVTGVIIPHQSDMASMDEVSLPSYFDESKFNLLHAGNLMKARDPQGLIEGFRRFLVNNPGAEADAKLILLGSADYHEKAINEAIVSIPEVYFANENVPYHLVKQMQKQTSVNIILEAKSEISPFLPGKFPDCVKANQPILLLGPHYSETKRLLGDSYQYMAEADQVDKIAKQIESLYNQWKKAPNKAGLNRPDLEHYVSKEYLAATIKKVLNHD